MKCRKKVQARYPANMANHARSGKSPRHRRHINLEREDVCIYIYIYVERERERERRERIVWRPFVAARRHRCACCQRYSNRFEDSVPSDDSIQCDDPTRRFDSTIQLGSHSTALYQPSHDSCKSLSSKRLVYQSRLTITCDRLTVGSHKSNTHRTNLIRIQHICICTLIFILYVCVDLYMYWAECPPDSRGARYRRSYFEANS